MYSYSLLFNRKKRARLKSKTIPDTTQDIPPDETEKNMKNQPKQNSLTPLNIEKEKDKNKKINPILDKV
jgi:hypothetical protein